MIKEFVAVGVAILAGVIILGILLIALLTCILVNVIKRLCKTNEPEPTEKHEDV